MDSRSADWTRATHNSCVWLHNTIDTFISSNTTACKGWHNKIVIINSYIFAQTSTLYCKKKQLSAAERSADKCHIIKRSDWDAQVWRARDCISIGVVSACANGLTTAPFPSSSPGRCRYRRLFCWRASAAASACSRSIFHKHTIWDSRFPIMLESCDICTSSAATPSRLPTTHGRSLLSRHGFTGGTCKTCLTCHSVFFSFLIICT